MTPVFGFVLVLIILLAIGAGCLLPFLGVAVSPKWRRSRKAWLWAGLPMALLFLAGMSCVVSNEREAAVAKAVERGDAREVRSLLDSGFPADARTDPYDPYGSPTAIHRAIDDKRWDIVRLLIDHGATDSYIGDDSLYEQSAVGMLDSAGQKELAHRLRQHGPPHF